jgi:proline iminopeptidase
MKRSIGLGTLILLFGFGWLPAQDFAGVRQINGSGVFCRAIGGGDPLVIVHGGPGLGHDYLLKPFSRLADRYRLVFYDQRGCGLSAEFRKDETVTMDDLVEELEGVRKEFHLENINLAGQSWGAVIAIHYAAKYPEHVKKLLLLEPAPGSSEYLPAFQKTIVERLGPSEKEELAALGSNPALRTDPGLFQKWMNLRFKAYYFDAGKQEMDKMAYFDGARVQKMFASSAMFGSYLSGFDLYGKMKEIACPTLIIHGDHDPIPAAAVERMEQAFQNADLVIVKNCGHFVHVERPEEYFAAIRSFLDGKTGAK